MVELLVKVVEDSLDGKLTTPTGAEVGGVLGVFDISKDELGERSGSARSSKPCGTGSLFNSSLMSL